jgi:hypothetical protein
VRSHVAGYAHLFVRHNRPAHIHRCLVAEIHPQNQRARHNRPRSKMRLVRLLRVRRHLAHLQHVWESPAAWPAQIKPRACQNSARFHDEEPSRETRTGGQARETCRRYADGFGSHLDVGIVTFRVYGRTCCSLFAMSFHPCDRSPPERKWVNGHQERFPTMPPWKQSSMMYCAVHEQAGTVSRLWPQADTRTRTHTHAPRGQLC